MDELVPYKALDTEESNLPETFNNVINNIIGIIISLRFQHWTTSSFAAHKTAEDAYTTLQGQLDQLVETALGSGDLTNLFPKTVNYGKMTLDQLESNIVNLKDMPLSDGTINVLDDILTSIGTIKYLSKLR